MTFTAVAANPGQPRKFFDAARLQELADSIAANGLLEPIVVREVAPDEFVIVAGERRWRASQIAGLPTIVANVIELDEAAAYVLSVAENLNRADMTVMEESEAFHQLRAYNHDVDEIAAMFGKQASFIQSRLSLSDLCPEARTLVDSTNIGPRFAAHIARLGLSNQRAVVNKWARGEFAHQEVAIEFASALHAAETEVGFFDLEEPTFEERQVHKKQSRATSSKLDEIQRATALLAEIAAQSPEELADLLGPETAVRLRELDRLAAATAKAHGNVRKAKMTHDARSMTVRQDTA